MIKSVRGFLGCFGKFSKPCRESEILNKPEVLKPTLAVQYSKALVFASRAVAQPHLFEHCRQRVFCGIDTTTNNHTKFTN